MSVWRAVTTRADASGTKERNEMFREEHEQMDQLQTKLDELRRYL
ncbi:hypothetical protein SAMN05661003_10711 [Desulfuromonas thiophila]|jgi:hypothetical protein|uniref:Uncharacterized protein n=1 Tax=Desulfuromonas thiophila TaxID=57664 RepID=A0A1G7BQV3_9BACT|nr:hypothetical protein SAMN05661003_10711 [Desulfuromonas thiophila]